MWAKRIKVPDQEQASYVQMDRCITEKGNANSRGGGFKMEQASSGGIALGKGGGRYSRGKGKGKMAELPYSKPEHQLLGISLIWWLKKEGLLLKGVGGAN